MKERACTLLQRRVLAYLGLQTRGREHVQCACRISTLVAQCDVSTAQHCARQFHITKFKSQVSTCQGIGLISYARRFYATNSQASTTTTGSTDTCNLTVEILKGDLKEYNAKVAWWIAEKGKTKKEAKELAQDQFNQTFEKGSEGDPKCKCGRLIREHSTQAKPLENLNWGKRIYEDVVNCKKGAKLSEKIFLLKKGGKSTWFATNNKDVLSPKVLIHREWHDSFWDKYCEDLATGGHRVAIIGTPGIGKTLALNVFLLNYLRSTADSKVVKKRYVALILPKQSRYYIFDTKDKTGCTAKIGSRPEWQGCGELVPFEDDLLVLHDLGKEAPLTPEYLPTVIATSPKYEKYNEFMKGSTRYFYVPLFTDDEMKFVAENLCPAHDYAKVKVAEGELCKKWEDASYYYGNVPRLVFAREGDMNALNAQLNALNLDSVESILQETTIQVNDRLLEYVPNTSFDDVSVRFRRGYVMKQLTWKFLAKHLKEWERIVKFTNNGHVFEEVVHQFLAGFPQYLHVESIVELKSDGTETKPSDIFQSLWPKEAWSKMPFASNAVYNVQAQQYYYPMKPNFAVIDSFVFVRFGNSKTVYLLSFQMTKTKEHRPTVSKLETFVKEVETLFRYREKPFKIDCAGKKLILDLGSQRLNLEIHLVYVTSEATFRYQGLKDGETNARMQNLWNCVKQYRSPLPQVGE